MLRYKVWHRALHNMGELHSVFNDRFKVKVRKTMVASFVTRKFFAFCFLHAIRKKKYLSPLVCDLELAVELQGKKSKLALSEGKAIFHCCCMQTSLRTQAALVCGTCYPLLRPCFHVFAHFWCSFRNLEAAMKALMLSSLIFYSYSSTIYGRFAQFPEVIRSE